MGTWSKKQRRPRRKLSIAAQVVVLVAVLGLVIWGVGSRGSQRPSHVISSPTATATGRPRLTRSCTQQEMAFNGAITDCAVPSRPIGNCTVNNVPTDCPCRLDPKVLQPHL
jgi:hypothetical protein